MTASKPFDGVLLDQLVSVDLDAAQAAIHRALEPLLMSVGIEPRPVECRIEPTGTGLAVHLTLPVSADRRLRSAIGVRVLDGLHAAATGTFGDVDVYVHPGAELDG